MWYKNLSHYGLIVFCIQSSLLLGGSSQSHLMSVAVASSSSASKPPHYTYKRASTDDEKVLVNACNLNNTPEIRRLLQQGTNPNIGWEYRGRLVAIVNFCITHGNIEAIELFMRHNLHKDPDFLLRSGILWKQTGEESLRCNIDERLAIAALFIAYNEPCDINMRGVGGSTILMFAALNTPELVAKLLEKGADPSLRDNDGRTALIYCTAHGSKERSQGKTTFQEYPIVQQLIAAKADPYARSNKGGTVLSISTDSRSRCLYARIAQYPAITQLIRDNVLEIPGIASMITAYIDTDYDEMYEADFPLLPPMPPLPSLLKDEKCIIS
jgi:hypothetical protein